MNSSNEANCTTDMNTFSIRDIENLCGIKAHTLRIWEKRYGILSPKRKDSNHRIYDNDDLKHWLRISYLYHKGFKISHIASLPPEELKKEALLGRGQLARYEHFINLLAEAAIGFDTAQFENTLYDCFQQFGTEHAMIHVVYPYLNKIGLLWLTDHVIPGQEHFSSNLINQKLLLAINDLKTPKPVQPRTVLLYTPLGEHHEIPVLFAYYLLKKNGAKVAYYGTNVSFPDIEFYLRR